MGVVNAKADPVAATGQAQFLSTTCGVDPPQERGELNRDFAGQIKDSLAFEYHSRPARLD